MSFPFGPRRRGTLHNTFPPGGRYGRGAQPPKKQMSSEIPKEEDDEAKETEQKQAE